MKIVITSQGPSLDSQVSPLFGRCPTYLLVDSDEMSAESLSNPAVGAAGGAGIQAAQFIVQRDADAVISGNVGPNAFNVLHAAGVPVYLAQDGTVQEAVEALKAGELQQVGAPNVGGHYGTGGGRGMGMGGGRGMGRGRR